MFLLVMSQLGAVFFKDAYFSPVYTDFPSILFHQVV